MVKVKYYSLSQKERESHFKELFSAIAALENTRDVENFFRDLMSPDELVMLSRRVQIAKLLLTGKTHVDIIEELNVGSTTIERVDKWLNQGFGGYREAIKKAKKTKGRIDYDSDDFPFSFDSLRKKYPAHFWLLNLIMDKKP